MAQEPIRKIMLPSHAECIAEAANYWAWIELEVHWMLWELADVHPNIGACFTAQMYTFTAKVDGLLALMRIRGVSQPIVDRVNKFSQSSREASDLRNRFVHDAWLIDNHDPAMMGRVTLNARRKLDFITESVAAEALQKDLGPIALAQQTITAIRKDLIAELPSLPKIPRGGPHPLDDIR